MINSISAREITWITTLWPQLFPKDVFVRTDKRINAICYFRDFFNSSDGKILKSEISIGDYNDRYLNLNVPILQAMTVNDIEEKLRDQPRETIGVVSLGLSLSCIPSYYITDEVPSLGKL